MNIKYKPMKIFKYVLVFLVIMSSVSAFAQQSDTLSFWKGGMLYQGKRYMKPAQIAPILLKNEDTEMSALFRKYKSNRGSANVFGFLGGVGMGYSLGSLIGGSKFPTGMFAAGVGVTAIGLIFNGKANKSLKRAIRLYNGKQAGKEISLSPLFYQEYWLAQVGLAIKL